MRTTVPLKTIANMFETCNSIRPVNDQPTGHSFRRCLFDFRNAGLAVVAPRVPAFARAALLTLLSDLGKLLGPLLATTTLTPRRLLPGPFGFALRACSLGFALRALHLRRNLLARPSGFDLRAYSLGFALMASRLQRHRSTGPFGFALRAGLFGFAMRVWGLRRHLLTRPFGFTLRVCWFGFAMRALDLRRHLPTRPLGFTLRACLLGFVLRALHLGQAATAFPRRASKLGLQQTPEVLLCQGLRKAPGPAARRRTATRKGSGRDPGDQGPSRFSAVLPTKKNRDGERERDGTWAEHLEVARASKGSADRRMPSAPRFAPRGFIDTKLHKCNLSIVRFATRPPPTRSLDPPDLPPRPPACPSLQKKTRPATHPKQVATTKRTPPPNPTRGPKKHGVQHHKVMSIIASRMPRHRVHPFCCVPPPSSPYVDGVVVQNTRQRRCCGHRA